MALVALADPVEGRLAAPVPIGGADSPPDVTSPDQTPEAARLRAVVSAHFQLVYRILRRMLPPDSADDATQQTFVTAARHLARIEPGRERAYLCKTAIGVAAHIRRSIARRREAPGDPALDEREGPSPTPEEAAEEKRRLQMLDEVLEGMPLELRTVFVLFELEELPTAEIATMLEIPVGTVASRLRRARQQFHDDAKRLRARLAFEGGVR